jgi:hypothetical protein
MRALMALAHGSHGGWGASRAALVGEGLSFCLLSERGQRVPWRGWPTSERGGWQQQALRGRNLVEPL